MPKKTKTIDKGTIEVTKDGYQTTISLNRKNFIEKFERTIMGSKRVEGNLENEDLIPDELYEAVSGFMQYDIMFALFNNEK